MISAWWDFTMSLSASEIQKHTGKRTRSEALGSNVYPDCLLFATSSANPICTRAGILITSEQLMKTSPPTRLEKGNGGIPWQPLQRGCYHGKRYRWLWAMRKAACAIGLTKLSTHTCYQSFVWHISLILSYFPFILQDKENQVQAGSTKVTGTIRNH